MHIINSATSGALIISLTLLPSACDGGDTAPVKQTPANDGPQTPETLVPDPLFNRRHPLLTLDTMLGPSPDWFIGVDGLSMQDKNGWGEKPETDLQLYDAGS